MSVRSSFISAASILLLLAAAAPLEAQKATVEDLCRLHGVGEETHIALIKAAYVEAVGAGITEEELAPFLTDILTHKLDCRQMVRVLAATTKLRREGLPYFIVMSKVREGVAKDAPPVLVVEAAESKLAALFASRDVLRSLGASGFRIVDFQNAALIVASYLEKGYSPSDVVTGIRKKGLDGAGFTALAGILEKKATPKKR